MPGSRTTLTKDLDPVIERVIERCLASDPKLRPSSALAVAAALPGGDPLAAALAAGETPSPEMVAAAGETEGMPVRRALMWLTAVLVCLVVGIIAGSQYNIANLTPFENSPDALAHRSRELIRSLGYTAPIADSAWTLALNRDYQTWAWSHLKPEQVKRSVTAGQPALITFHYRQGPDYLDPYNADGIVLPKDPPPIVPGMCEILVDPQGRLIDFAAVPPREEANPPVAIAPADWKTLFAAAGLDMAQFTTAAPKSLPLGAFDARAAWTGVFPSTPDIPLRIEAASWRGRPTEFHLVTPWTRPPSTYSGDAPRAAVWIAIGLFLALTTTACLLAWRNLRLGRGDRNGAARLAAFMAAIVFLRWLFMTHFAPTFFQYLRFTWAVSAALWGAGIAWALYVALEPYVRRRWPQSLISWTRLLSGGFGDPLVGEHLLQGMALGVASYLISVARSAVLSHNGDYPGTGPVDAITDIRSGVSNLLSEFQTDILVGVGFLFFFFLVRLLVRRQWIAVLVVAGLLIALFTSSSNHPVAELSTTILLSASIVYVMVRFGLLVFVFYMVGQDLINSAWPTLALSAWYSGRMIVMSVLVIAISLYAFRTALAGRPIFGDKFLE
jgi:serine/threonine-protein kinase